MLTAKEIDEHELHGAQPVMQVADMNAALAFYRDVLGFEVDFVAGEPPVAARVSSGARDHASAARIRLVSSDAAGARADKSYTWIHVGRDLDGLFEKYRKAGVDIVSAPENRPWGLRDFRVRDPDGHLFCFAGEI